MPGILGGAEKERRASLKREILLLAPALTPWRPRRFSLGTVAMERRVREGFCMDEA